jgi:hypothetical protein
MASTGISFVNMGEEVPAHRWKDGVFYGSKGISIYHRLLLEGHMIGGYSSERIEEILL